MAAKLTYGEQLKHPNWQRKRLEVLNLAEFACQRCYDKDSTLHVHHKHYVKGRMAWEYEAKELAALCESCHQVAHEEQAEINALLASLPIDGPLSASEAAGLIAGWAGKPCKSFGDYGWNLGMMLCIFDDADTRIHDVLDLQACLLIPDFVADLRELMKKALDAKQNHS